MGYAFISYSSKNKTQADAIRDIFGRNNIDTWMAPYNIPAGSNYASVITRAVKDCSCFVLLLTNDSQSSDAVDSEVELAKNSKKRIFAVEPENIILNDAFTYYIHNKHIIPVNKIDEKSAEMQKFLSDVSSYICKNISKESVMVSDKKAKKDESIEQIKKYVTN
jgi:hypothetical protein